MKANHMVRILVILLFAFNATAQQGINYKAIINDSNGSVLANTEVTVQFTILENGTISVYQEFHNTTTDVNGIVILNIGEGNPAGGDFTIIDWGSNPHFLKTEVDKGEGFINMGTTEFKAVPYALYANTATRAIIDEVDDTDADPTNELQTLTIIHNILSLSDGGSVELPLESIGSGQYYYADKDGDGYGFPFDPVYVPTGVNIPAGFVSNSGDCNDENNNIHPGAVEIIDGIDNNCNGQIDEGF